MRSIAWFVLVSGVALSIVACGDDDGDEENGMGDAGHEHELPDVDCSEDVPAFEEVAAFEKCTLCHSSELTGDERMNAPEGDDWDIEAEAIEHRELIAHEVFEGEMPPEDSNITLTTAEKEELYLWALCD
jgi:uncharacterized membrane protein